LIAFFRIDSLTLYRFLIIRVLATRRCRQLRVEALKDIAIGGPVNIIGMSSGSATECCCSDPLTQEALSKLSDGTANLEKRARESMNFYLWLAVEGNCRQA